MDQMWYHAWNKVGLGCFRVSNKEGCLSGISEDGSQRTSKGYGRSRQPERRENNKIVITYLSNWQQDVPHYTQENKDFAISFFSSKEFLL